MVMTIPPHIQELIERLLEQDDEHAIILLDPNGLIVAWMAAAEIVFGYTSGEMVGQPVEILFTPEDRAQKMPEYELAVASSDGHAEDDRWMLRRDGRRFWAVGVMIPIRTEAGEILGFGKILRNRTDIKGQLESAQRQIERLKQMNESKNVFIATLAHELRNPLASIRNSLTFLEFAGSQNDDCRYARATAQRQLDHMQRMIEDLLDVAKADVGKVQLDIRVMPLNGIVEAAVETCQAVIDKSIQTLQLLITDQPIMVKADSSRLLQIFVNLIHNAAKFTNLGGHIWVKVSVEGSEAVVRVEDTGVGISAEMMPQIFDLFTQADSGSGGGLGIGLSLVKNLTNLHGGTVQVRSDGLGKGSEFTVRLPLVMNDEERPDSPTSV